MRYFLILLFSLCLKANVIKTEINASVCVPNIKGKWTNELGSVMIITEIRSNNIYGRYCTAVSRKPIESINKLVGNIGNVRCRQANTPIGFTVTYYRKNMMPLSTATWSGQYRKDGGVEKIHTTWLLTTPKDKVTDIWASTLIGKDTFWRGNSSSNVKC